jgi:peptidoglycan/LPS O-acetylase OafA/YrhL
MSRRHDLDALRAFAMLLGIALHAALSFTGLPWLVRDSQSCGGFALFVTAVHGFRMPLFFLLSGFFTALLWRRRGLRALLAHRWRRIVVPLLLELVTVVPATHWVAALATRQANAPERQNPGGTTAAEPDTLWRAAAAGRLERVEELLEAGANPDEQDPAFGATALTHAALFGRENVVNALLQRGADPMARNRGQGTALHAAAFLGRAEMVRRLLEAGADAGARNERGETPGDSARANRFLTRAIMDMLGIPVDEESLRTGREEALRLLGPESPAGGRSPLWRPLLLMLTQFPLFHHLWFLWFLCWMVAGFALVAWVTGKTGLPLDWGRWVATPRRWFWLVPLTALPAFFMGRAFPNFGPDTSSAVLPPPYLLFYYALFFGFGVLVHETAGAAERLGRRWRLALPLALVVLWPAGLALVYARQLNAGDLGPGARALSAVVQAAYAWAMCAGLTGLFQHCLHRERRWTRYLADASYWMYVAHLPLVVAAQMLVRDWQMSASLKFLIITGGVSALLLLSYHFLVRPTWLGRLLNGPRPAGAAGNGG